VFDVVDAPLEHVQTVMIGIASRANARRIGHIRNRPVGPESGRWRGPADPLRVIGRAA